MESLGTPPCTLVLVEDSSNRVAPFLRGAPFGFPKKREEDGCRRQGKVESLREAKPLLLKPFPLSFLRRGGLDAIDTMDYLCLVFVKPLTKSPKRHLV